MAFYKFHLIVSMRLLEIVSFSFDHDLKLLGKVLMVLLSLSSKTDEVICGIVYKIFLVFDRCLSHMLNIEDNRQPLATISS